MSVRKMPVLFVASRLFLWTTDAFPQDRPLFAQYERRVDSAHPNPLCKQGPFERVINYSELVVFDSHEAVYRTSRDARCHGEAGDPAWMLRWEAPGEQAAAFRYTLSGKEFEELKSFMERADIKELESFRNAGPGVGDFKITIARPTGSQDIDVVSLMPTHYSLVEKPALIHLICMAKAMARRSPNSGELPEWCGDAAH
jgi:hypothetical protein